MKRALSGKKSKQATPARKLAAKLPSGRPKSKPAKIAAKKRVSVPKVKARPAKTKLAKPKVARIKVVTAKAAKPKRSRVTRRKAVKVSAAKTKVVRTKPAILASRLKPARGVTRPAELVTTKHTVSQKVLRKVNRKPEFTVPAFLLEGDEPSYPASGSGEKFALGPTPPLDHFDEAKAPLPESYGTGRLFLTARDPHWLYAHWDFTMQEQFRYNAQSVDRHMVLRLHDAAQPGAHISEVHVHPESRHWFTHVDVAGKNYVAEIGYYQPSRKWKSLATSEPRRTPPDNISTDATIEFATIPLELPFETMLALLKEQSSESSGPNVPLARGIEQIRVRAQEHFPQATPATDWTAEQENALAQILAASRAGAALPGSEEFIPQDAAWPEFAFDAETGAAAPLPSPTSYVSSFFGGKGQKDFWFNVNAELIVYGATEPNAAVTFAGKEVPLRSDGSFRFHFSLPDGQYELPVTAISADRTDGRAADLKFARATEFRGHVAAAPADPALKPPPSGSA